MSVAALGLVTTAAVLAGLPGSAQAAGTATPTTLTGTTAGLPDAVVEPAPVVTSAQRQRAEQDRLASASAATTGIPALHSNPGSRHTILIDVDGQTVAGQRWPGLPASYTAVPWSIDADPAVSSTEADRLREVWAAVSEDFAPFDVDVTTVDPGTAALVRSSNADQTYGMRVVLSDSDSWKTLCKDVRCAGVAHVDVLDSVETDEVEQAWVYPQNFADSARTMADAISHEVGHTLGLEHDGTLSPRAEYYDGQGSWGPLMGVSGSRTLTQWSNGDYASASNRQDDLAVIAANGLPLLADDAGDSAQDAASGVPVGTRTIGTSTDTDWFRLSNCRGGVEVEATVAAVSPDLDLDLSVRDAAGTVLGDAGRSALSGSVRRIVVPAASGDLYVRLDGVGNGSPTATGYSDYGSLGRYTLRATGNCVARAGVSDAPQAVAALGSGTSARLSWAAPAAAGTSEITGYRVTVSPTGQVLTTDAAGRGLDVSGLRAGTPYTFAVVATNAAGNSPAAAVVLTLPEAAGQSTTTTAPTTSATTTVTGADRLVATSRPRLRGPVTTSRRTAVTAGTWNHPVTLSYRWSRGAKLVSRSASYTPRAGDVGNRLTVTVTATAAGRGAVVTTLRTARVGR